ncbi:hypothetical protein Slin15195_G093120 [Septoria linicola]|uniref:NTF2-like domain-containing protein n=1 Tax=Septoria linicola TaxID=215465 RepID=A0A9Q9B1S2_9PEZI|nr:hypothetical protein Slin14017_G056230 [Septoria linicola]USW55993.1 hypothetical protein Slin15195_G093120 [Septoria linicola]
MHFTTIAVASAAFAATAIAAPHEPEHPVWRNEWHGKGYGRWGKGKQNSPPSYDPAPTSYAPAPTSYAPTPSGYEPVPTGYEPTPTSPASPTVPTPNPGNGTSPECPTVPAPSNCLTDEQAAAGADIFRRLIQDYSDELALEALTEDFVDYSSAVNIIRNRGNEGPFVVNGISFASRAAFMAAQGAQPLIPFDTLNTFHGCSHVATRWQTLRSANGQPTEANDIPVVGNGILVTVPDAENSYGFRVKELYSEFNAAAWLVNNGVFTPSAVTTSNFPEGTAAPVKRDHDSLAHLMGAAGRMI